MGRYTPAIKLDRRKRLSAPNNLDVVRTAMLGVFMILLAFFVALVANTKPNEKRTVDVLGTLQSRFQNVGKDPALTAPAEIPVWLASETGGQAAPLDDLKRDFPDAFAGAQNNWGALELRFTPDDFQKFILTRGDLAKRIFTGLSEPLDKTGVTDPYMLEVSIGTENTADKNTQKLHQKIRTDLLSFGIDASRLLLGYESGAEGITLRMTPASRYEGVL